MFTLFAKFGPSFYNCPRFDGPPDFDREPISIQYSLYLHLPGSWVTFKDDSDEDDAKPFSSSHTSSSNQPPPPANVKEDEQPAEQAEKPSRPPPPASRPEKEKPASRHPEIISTDPDHPAMVLGTRCCLSSTPSGCGVHNILKV